MTTHTVAKPIRLNRDTVEILLVAYKISKRRVAETAGVGRYTVSKALRNRRDVGPEKRMAVLQAIATLTGRDPEALVMGRLAA